MDIWNEQIINRGKEIFKKRQAFTEEFSELFRKIYAEISGSRETVELQYSSQLNEGDFSDLFTKALSKDKAVLYTTTGVHKDDWLFFKEEYSLKKFASQGQQKSFIIALKLAQFAFLKKRYNTPPIVLLDDMFDKLDEERVNYLINMVTGKDFGQVFITDTSQSRMKQLLETKEKDCRIIPISEGSLQEAQPNYA